MRPLDPRLLRAAPAARRPVAALAVVGVLQGLATVATAFALAALVVAAVRGEPLREASLSLAALLALRAGLAWTAERTAARAGARVTAALRTALLRHWLTVPAERRPDPDRGGVLAAQGVAAVEPYAARFLPALVSAAVVPAAALVALLVVDPVSALVVVLTLPLLPAFAALIGMATRDDTARRWASLSALSGHFADVVRGLPTLVGYGRAERQAEVVGEVSRRHRTATMRTLRTAFMSSAALELLASISVAIVAVTVGLRLTHGTVDLGTGLLAILLAPEAYWPVRRVGAAFHDAADGAEAVADVLAAIDGDPAVADGAATGRSGVERSGAGRSGVDVRLEDVTYTYPGAASPVLAGLDLAAGPGLTVLTGPSGCGKTTVLELVAGLRTPDTGSVRAGRTHLVTQRPFLPAGTLREVLRLGSDADDPALWDALRAVGLDGFVAALPAALDTRVGDDGVGLSAGQRARVVLARAMLSDAPVLLLDEPTAHLDPAASALVHDVLARLAERRTVLVVTHRPELVARADRHLTLAARPVEALR
ncbi:thiol reductant ABC exporter subunit CydD [Phycicoccus sp. BSK3Z-2]|uniref:Thiol reductant ABC exporter subunit CydD n=1 Tax=Phycicoccus avicenniae TaxID=2828860 RepID=A0A941I0S2_9MICO|nr:thiol reductant ABC exporter subunit CydD [Phycicoccus avicenniae]MBR7744215.1 thiol reductant ABC exporter subunit CydD [Phycicoccus avicenniae]